jgi:hypothetical protein
MPEMLYESGRCLVNWPSQIPFPSEEQVPSSGKQHKGIKELQVPQVNILYDAILDEKYKPQLTKVEPACEYIVSKVLNDY